MSKKIQSRVVVAVEPSTNATKPSANKRKRSGRRNRQRNVKNQVTSYQALNVRGLKVHPCSVRYARALCDPWSTYSESQAVCLPDDNEIPSFKYSLRLRGQAYVGTSSYGFVTLSPWAFAVNGAACLGGSDVGYASSASPTDTKYADPTTYKTWVATSNSPISSAHYVRPVCIGLRIRYSGTELNKGGVAAPYRAVDSSFAGLSNFANVSYADVMALNRTDAIPNNRQWVGTVWTPINAEMRSYRVPLSGGTVVQLTNDNAAQTMGIVFSGEPGNVFEVDAVGFFEAVSRVGQVVPNVSASDSDMTGYSFIRDVYSKVADSSMGKGLWNLIKTGAANYINMQVGFPALPTSGFTPATSPMIEEI